MRTTWLSCGVVILALVGCHGGDTGKPIPTTGTSSPGGPDMSKAPDVTMTAADYAAEFKKDKKAAAEKYNGKIIQLTGTVDHFAKNITGDVEMLLAVKGDFVGVICFTTDKQPWNHATPGQSVQVKGAFPEITFSPALVHCVIVEASGTKAPTLTAEALGKEYDADAKAVEEKYKDKWLFLTGTVADKQEKDKAVRVFFKTDSKVKVVASFTPTDKADADQIKVGDKVRVIGHFSELYAEKGEVAVGQCLNAGEAK
jgi:hypothetical protein